MNILLILKALGGYTKDSKQALAIVVACGVLWQQMTGYVDKKHSDGMATVNRATVQLEATQAKIVSMELREIQSETTLKSIEVALNGVSERMRLMDLRFWELYRDSKRNRAEEYSHTRIGPIKQEEELTND